VKGKIEVIKEQKRFLWLWSLEKGYTTADQQMSVTKRESTTVMSILDVIVGQKDSSLVLSGQPQIKLTLHRCCCCC